MEDYAMLLIYDPDGSQQILVPVSLIQSKPELREEMLKYQRKYPSFLVWDEDDIIENEGDPIPLKKNNKLFLFQHNEIIQELPVSTEETYVIPNNIRIVEIFQYSI